MYVEADRRIERVGCIFTVFSAITRALWWPPKGWTRGVGHPLEVVAPPTPKGGRTPRRVTFPERVGSPEGGRTPTQRRGPTTHPTSPQQTNKQMRMRLEIYAPQDGTFLSIG